MALQVCSLSRTLDFPQKNICVRLDFDLNSIATKVKLYIKDINDFFKKLQNLYKRLDDT